ncbi:MAG TPA: hypothetical protein EYG74_05080, partial [Sulfurimonas autotrophica]|nr:hypothetical protein [Sulfurimonas autotrophica]
PELRGKVIAEYDFTVNKEKAVDTQGHGTKMASIIASANDGHGITGIAYKAKLIDAKVVSDDGSISNENIIKAIDFSIKYGANVINMSFSSGKHSNDLEKVIAKHAKKGVVFVAAAGNDGEKALAYPAGYKHVVAVSSLDKKTKERAIYANHGEYIDTYVEDGIWAYDGEKYSRGYGTSEACAIVSGYQLDSYTNTKIGYKIDTVGISLPSSSPLVDEISPFADSNENKFLYDLANYNLIQIKFKGVISSIVDLQLGAIPSYSTNPFTTLAHDFSMDSVITPNAYIILFDLFGEYSRYAYSKDKSHQVKEILDSDVNKYKKLLKPLVSDFEKLTRYSKSTASFFSTLNEIILSTKGKTDPLSKTIRKWANYALNGVYDKDITKYKTKYIQEKIVWNDKRFERIGKTLKMLSGLLSAYDSATKAFSSFTNAQKEISLFSIYAIDYLVALEALPVEDKNSPLTSEILEIVDDSLNDSAELDNLLQYFIASAVVDIFQNVAGNNLGAAIHGKAKAMIKKKINGGIGSGVFFDVVADIVGDTANEVSSGYMYLLYLDLVSDVQDKSFKKVYKEGLTIEDMSNNLLSVSILQKFTYHSLKYLIAVASNPMNIQEYDKQKLKDLLSNYEIEEYGVKFKFTEEDWFGTALKGFKYATSNVLSNFSVTASQFLQRNSKYGVKTLDIIFNTNAYENLSPEKNIEAYFESISNKMDFRSNDSNYKKLEKIFTKYNNFSQIMVDYKNVLSNLFANKTTVQAVDFSNKKNNEKITAIKNIVKYNDKFIPVYDAGGNVIDIDYKEGLMLYQKETMDTLMTKQMLMHKDDPISRKLFTEMMLKVLDNKKNVHNNPFDDTEFLLNLFNKQVTIFDDIDKVGVTLNEKLWVEYGKSEGIVNGYDGNRLGDFGPNEELMRHQAMIIVGKILKKNGYVYDEEKVRGIMFKMSMKTNHWDIFNKHEESIGLCIQEGIIVGYKDSDSVGAVIRPLGLNDTLSFYQSSVIAKRLYQKLTPNSILNKGETVGDIYDNYYDYIDPVGSIQIRTTAWADIPVVSGGGTTLVKANFNVNREYLDRVSIQWKPMLGVISDFEKHATQDGEIESTIQYTAPAVDEESIIPIVVKIQLSEHHIIRKKYYVRVVPSSEYTEETTDSTQPNTTLSALYIDTTDEFKVSWNSQNTKNLEILYSYEKTNWSRFALLNLDYYNGTSDTEKVDGSRAHDVIYFKTISSDGTNRVTSSILTLDYSAQTANTNDKNTEVPVQAVMKTLKSSTYYDYVIPSWRMVLDSHGNDNVVSYELSYADNSSFSNDTKVNVGANRSYRVKNLQDNEKYYFRVRAINNKGTGEWSVWESTRIDLENLPVFSTTEQTPSNGTTGVSKTPTFRWEASDADGDDLEYYVRIGTDPSNLNFKSGWIEGTKRFRYSDEFTRPLKPNTTYYWQVTYREGHRMSEFYGGEYPKSPMWSFTTLGTGPDLAVTNVRMIGDVK